VSDREGCPFRLDGRVAVVTGASRNVGLEIARAFAAAGAGVVMAARDADQLGARAAEIRDQTGAAVMAVAADVTSVADTDRLISRVLDAYPQVDVLVNNAYASGNTFGRHVLDIEDEAWDITFRANVLGPFRLCRGFGRSMLAGRGGAIINVLSGSAFQPTWQNTPYGSTKAALWAMTRYLSVELAPAVRVNALVPGLTMSETGGPPAGPVADSLLAMVPMGRAGRPEEVARAALYLASEAASYTSGTALFVNGGRLW
jgi:NAD(P)-dependent dehydrogenase (short-subunit alcohol dehydrogenase family)